jgi:hypothetical protein
MRFPMRPKISSGHICTALIAAVALAWPMRTIAGEAAVVRIEAIGTVFRATLSDGTVKQGKELAGAVLVFEVQGSPVRIRIASIMPDPGDKTGSVLLHDFRSDERRATV